MPRIPTKRGSVQTRRPLDPRISSDGAGLESRALSQAANQITDFTLNLMQKRKRAADTNFARTSYLEDIEAANAFETQLKQEEGENPENYAERMNGFLAERSKMREKNAPSSDALELYKNQAEPFFTRSRINADNYQNVKKAEYYYKSEQERVGNIANGYIDNPNYVQARDVQVSLDEQFDRDVEIYGEEVAKKSLVDNKNMIAESVLAGLESQERYYEGLNILTNNEAEGKLTQELTPERKAILVKRFKSGIEAKKREGIQELRREVTDLYNAATQGDLDEQKAIEVQSKIQGMPIEKDDKKRLLDKVQVSVNLSPALNQMRSTPTGMMPSGDEVVSKLPGNYNEGQRKQARAIYEAERARDARLRESDGAGYVLRHFPNVQKEQENLSLESLIDKTMFYQEELNIQNARPLPVERVKLLAQQIEAQPPREAAETIGNLLINAGRNAGPLMSQLSKDGKMKEDYLLLGSVSNPAAVERIVDNIKNEKNFDDLISKSESMKMAKNQLKAVYDNHSEYQDLMNSFKRPGDISRSSFAVALSNQIDIESRRNITQGMAARDAVDKAVQNVFDANYFQTEGSVPTIIPRGVRTSSGLFEVNQDVVEKYIRTHTTRDYVKSLGIEAPDSFSATFQGMSKKEINDRFHKQVSDHAFWDLASDQKSLVLKTRMNAGGEIVALQDSQGRMIKADLIELHQDPDDFFLNEKTTLQRVTDFFDFGSFGRSKADE